MKRVIAALALGGAGAVAMGAACATPRPDEGPKPYIRVLADVKASGAPCDDEHKVDVVRGPVPEGMVVVTGAGSTAVNGMRAGLTEHEKLAVKLARRFCADGVSVLQAVESAGAVTSTTMALWRLPRPGEVVPGTTTGADAAGSDAALLDAGVPDAGDLGASFDR